MLRSTLPADGSRVLTAGPSSPLQRTGGLWGRVSDRVGFGVFLFVCLFSLRLVGFWGLFFYFPLGHPARQLPSLASPSEEPGAEEIGRAHV